MFSKVARAAFLLILGVMIVSWAVTASKSNQAEPPGEPPLDRMYS